MTWFQGRSRTFAEVDESSSRLAAGLGSELGVRAGDRVAILDKNSDDYIELMFALDKAGAVTIPVNWRLTASEVVQVVNDADPRLLVAGEQFGGSVGEVRCRTLGFAELPRAEGGDPHLDQEDAVTWQLYTSGTTGVPKGAMLTNRNLLGLVGPLGFEVPEVVEGSRSLVAMPLYHIGGSGWALAALAYGATAVVVREVLPAELLKIIVAQRVETGFLVPAVLLFMTQLPGVEESDFSALKNVVYGASPISQELLRRSIDTFRCRFTQVYGLTETTGAITALRHEDHTGQRLLSCGRPMFGVEIRALDPMGGQVAPGEIGEIVYRGSGLMAGYWQRPEDTAAAVRDGWFHSGDAGSIDEDGFIYIRDRIKDMIVSGGENIYPAELESQLAGHPDVADVAVIGVPDDRWGEAVKALVVRKPGASLTGEELIEWSRSRLAGYKRPRTVDFIEAIPRNPSGKILKRELREPYWAGQARQVH
ncbi:MAG: acyl-CoA synthetase [Candidatus Nephthysia bennettiae]|uniref:AMP-binding protein n=2 Tax=Candidatus Nephthysia bennettiae TaxID=3127016 RepID=A0A934N7T9_9BACT|nr:AMP-binding protein [Candidatus Dormibacteraeota bacterium]PZR89611.1 MAG: acyl-CoA synthetase [Candidatus Dormibacteraeota bacterium]